MFEKTIHYLLMQAKEVISLEPDG